VCCGATESDGTTLASTRRPASHVSGLPL
jgi:hypothetical protein